MSYLPCELHCHSVHSDGAFQVKDLLNTAKDDHLALIALTDHNTMSGHSELDDSILPSIKGIEWTTFYGHMLVLGAKEFVDWRDAVPNNIDEKIKQVKAVGGLVGIAHPFQIGAPVCTGGRWEFNVKNWGNVDYMEIWHEDFNRISMENPFIGDYDAASGKLNIGFDKMASISFNVPEGDLDSFKDSKNLSFDNAVYVLNDADEFEIAYVEVRNETTNKVYIYDNIGRTKLTALEDDANFVPLEIIQQANREEEALQAIKETVVEENKQEKLITDNTQINVKTEVIPDVDADGNKILNYKVGYQYEVINKEFSAKEDFPSGGYDIEKSNAAMSLMKIIKNAFEGDFAGYLAEGKQVKVIITGSADASPIRGRIAYRGQYGSFVDEPYYKNGNLDNITVTPETGITQNEQLALLRAAGVTNYIKNNITTLQNTKNEYEYHVEVAKERGGEYRRINVEFVIVDAFKVQ